MNTRYSRVMYNSSKISIFGLLKIHKYNNLYIFLRRNNFMTSYYPPLKQLSIKFLTNIDKSTFIQNLHKLPKLKSVLV